MGLDKGTTEDVRWVLSQPGIETGGEFLERDFNNFLSNFKSKESVLQYAAWWLDKYGKYVPGLSAGTKMGSAVTGTTVSGERIDEVERSNRLLWGGFEFAFLWSGVATEPKPVQVKTTQPKHQGQIKGNSTNKIISSESVNKIETPYGYAVQSNKEAALAARPKVESGATLYRIGTTGKSQAAEAQFWSLENPLSPGFANRYGIPEENIINADFIETGVLKPGTPFVTRPAPGIGENIGGGIEVVVTKNGVILRSFNVAKEGF
jgi:hypothetical protein